MNRLIKVLVALVAVLALTTPVAASQKAIVLEFEKAGQGGYFEGELDGVTIRMTVTGFEMRGDSGHITATVEMEWMSGTTPQALTAEVEGVLAFNAGRAALNGTVISGDYLGARVHEESQLVGFDPATNIETYLGTFQIMPGS